MSAVRVRPAWIAVALAAIVLGLDLFFIARGPARAPWPLAASILSPAALLAACMGAASLPAPRGRLLLAIGMGITGVITIVGVRAPVRAPPPNVALLFDGVRVAVVIAALTLAGAWAVPRRAPLRWGALSLGIAAGLGAIAGMALQLGPSFGAEDPGFLAIDLALPATYAALAWALALADRADGHRVSVV